MATTKRATSPPLGASEERVEVVFRYYAPERRRIDIVLYARDGMTRERRLRAKRERSGFFVARFPRPSLGGRVFYRLSIDGGPPIADPFARAQPFGVHGASEVVSDAFAWTDAGFMGLELGDLVVYELHVGTATREGTFDALIARLAEIRAFGATAIELMPVASFAGARNWGYDGVSLFAPAAVYGGPDGLRRFVDAAHAHGLGVLLDVVYNHLGPEGNTLGALSDRFFDASRSTPWGRALNFKLEPFRRAILDNAAMWIETYHVDGLRLDSTPTIGDDDLLAEIADSARTAGSGRKVLIVAEDDRNDRRLLLPREEGGLGLDGVWADDFHFTIRRAFTGESEGLFGDFEGTASELARLLERGWLYEGQTSTRLGRTRGSAIDGIEPMRFIHTIQNHDQIGNRALGDRLGMSAPAAVVRAMTALLLLSPYTPLLFMGQEVDAQTPFLYFTDFEPGLGRAVELGRKREFAAYASFRDVDVPNPQNVDTFVRSKLPATADERGLRMLALTTELLAMRRSHPAFRKRDRDSFSARAQGTAVFLERRGQGRSALVIINLKGDFESDLGPGAFSVLLSTEEARFGGEGLAAYDGRRVRISGSAALVLVAMGPQAAPNPGVFEDTP